MESDLYYNFMLLLFSEIYDQYKLSPDIFSNTIIEYFKELNIQFLENITKGKNNKFSKPNIEANLKHLDLFSNIHETRSKLISITENKKEINQKIDIFLGFYCIHFKYKSFINFVDINNSKFKEIYEHLSSNKKIFNGFNSEILNFELLDEAENLEQIQTILNFIPNRLELFKVLSSKNLYHAAVVEQWRIEGVFLV